MKALPQHFLGGGEEKDISEDGQCPVRDLNGTPPEYKSRV
jgi:hypothetical protein